MAISISRKGVTLVCAGLLTIASPVWGSEALWTSHATAETDKTQLQSSRMYLNPMGGIIVTSSTGGIRALDPSTGQVTWTNPNNRVDSSFTFPKDTGVAILTTQDKLEVLDLTSGKIVWTLDRDKPGFNLKQFSGAMLVPEKSMMLLVASGFPGGKGGTVVAVDLKTGAELWRTDKINSDNYWQIVSTNLSPLVFEGGMILQISGTPVNVDPKTGNIIWTGDGDWPLLGSDINPMQVGDNLIVVSGSYILAYDIHTGKHRWATGRISRFFGRSRFFGSDVAKIVPHGDKLDVLTASLSEDPMQDTFFVDTLDLKTGDSHNAKPIEVKSVCADRSLLKGMFLRGECQQARRIGDSVSNRYVIVAAPNENAFYLMNKAAKAHEPVVQRMGLDGARSAATTPKFDDDMPVTHFEILADGDHLFATPDAVGVMTPAGNEVYHRYFPAPQPSTTDKAGSLIGAALATALRERIHKTAIESAVRHSNSAWQVSTTTSQQDIADQFQNDMYASVSNNCNWKSSGHGKMSWRTPDALTASATPPFCSQSGGDSSSNIQDHSKPARLLKRVSPIAVSPVQCVTRHATVPGRDGGKQ
jgi:hypothetical protein